MSAAKSPIATPQDVRRAAERRWSDFITHAVAGKADSMFPLTLRVRVRPKSGDGISLEQMATAVQELRKHAKESVGSGYTIHFARRRSRNWGEQDFPDCTTVDTADDLIDLVDRREEFERTMAVSRKVREAFPDLETWIAGHSPQLSRYAEIVDSLIEVCREFRRHPFPDCYVRELRIPADTKFIQQNETTLRYWLDILLPPSAIRVEESSFARRYGLRDGLPHHLLKLLDANLQAELGLLCDELSLPMRHLEKLPVTDCTVIIVENRTNLLTLPSRLRTLALGGVGDAVTRLRDVTWMDKCRLLYWGDIDVDGFRILRNLRALFPHLKSVMMNAETLDAHRHQIGDGNQKTMGPSHLLTVAENEALTSCSNDNLRLEQEKIFQEYVIEAFNQVEESGLPSISPNPKS